MRNFKKTTARDFRILADRIETSAPAMNNNNNNMDNEPRSPGGNNSAPGSPVGASKKVSMSS